MVSYCETLYPRNLSREVQKDLQHSDTQYEEYIIQYFS